MVDEFTPVLNELSNSMHPQADPGLPTQPQLLEGATAALPGPPPPSLPGVTLFTPHSTASPAVFPAQTPQSSTGYAASHTEQAYFNSREQASCMATGPPPPVTFAPGPSQTPFSQEHQGGPPPQPVPFQPVPPISSSSQWAPDHGSRPPSVQNYFQPTSDPPPQPFNIPQQSQTYPSHVPSPQFQPDSQHVSTTGPGRMFGSTPVPVPYSQESSTLSILFKDSYMENEETLAGEGKKAVSGIPESFQPHSNLQSAPQAQSSHSDALLDYQGASLQDQSHLPYMNDGNHSSPGKSQRLQDSQCDHVENLECVQNQEVLPCETHSSPTATASHGVGAKTKQTGVITYNSDRATPTQFTCSSLSSGLDPPSLAEPYNMPLDMDGPAPDNPLMSSLLPGPPPQGVQLMPPAPTIVLQDGMAPPQPMPAGDVPQFCPVPPSAPGPPGQIPVAGYPPHDSGFAPPPFQSQPEQLDMYPGAPPQPGPPPPLVSPVLPHMSPLVQHRLVQTNHPPPQMPPHMPPSPGHIPAVEQPFQAPPEMHTAQPISSSPCKSSMTPQMDFYDHLAHMGPGRRSRATSQSSMHMASERRSRTTSESSTHSGGRERSSSAVKQASPPPPSIPKQPHKQVPKRDPNPNPKKGGRGRGGWLKWLYWKGKNGAHLPDDKNKSPAPTTVLQDGMAPPQPMPADDVPLFYPVPPSAPGPPGQIPVAGYPLHDSGFAPPPFQPQPEQVDMYLGAPPQPGPTPPHVSPVSLHMSPLVQHRPVQMNHRPPQMPPHMPPSPGRIRAVEQPFQATPEMHTAPPISSSPCKSSMTPQIDFYDHMAHMGPGRRSRTASQSSIHMASGRRSRTTSVSSTHSVGRERSSSAVKQASPPPPSIPKQLRKQVPKRDPNPNPKKGGGGRGGWLNINWKGKNGAHLPDDKNKFNPQWVDLNQPEEESKPPLPGFPMMTLMLGPGGPAGPPSGGPPVDMFSRRAEGSEGGNEQSSANIGATPQMFNPTLLPSAPEGPSVPDGSQSGELSRSSSTSSLSRKVSQHLNQSHPAQGPAPTGGDVLPGKN